MRQNGSSGTPTAGRPSRYPETERRRAVAPLFAVLESRFSPHIERGVLLGVSGGPDSRALLEVTAQWPGRFRGPIHVASVAHGHRISARAEAELVVARARVLGFNAMLLSGRAERGDEATLRDLRYRHLVDAAQARGLGAVAVAHHMGDVAEGVLLDVMGAGGGAHGAKMAETREIAPGIQLLRPFLNVEKGQLWAALTALGVNQVFRDLSDVRRENARAHIRARLTDIEADAPGSVQRLAARASERALFGEVVLETARAAIERDGDDFFTPGPRRAHGPKAWRALWGARLREALGAAVPGRDLRASRRTLEAAAAAIVSGGEGKTFQFSGASIHVTGNHRARLLF